MSQPFDDDTLTHLCGYIGVVRDALRMNNWDVNLFREVKEDEDIYAHTWQSDNHDVINIQLAPGFFEGGPEKITETVVHELTHAMHRDVSGWWEGCTINNEDVPKSQSESWDKDFRMFMERFVSWTAKRICDGGHIPVFNPKTRYKISDGLTILDGPS